jgi:valyl-tRNA synthetase
LFFNRQDWRAKERKGKMELPKHYKFKEAEEKLKTFWKESKLFEFNLGKNGEKYVIDTPPPTVSGAMHLGHAFSYAHGDFIARYKRMKGFNVYYPFGTDDNGLPTEKLVESIKNIKAEKIKREEFVKLCWSTIKEIRDVFLKPWIDLGISAEFPGYSTISPDVIKTSQLSFIDLYRKGHIYQQEAPMVWCTECQTAIAQAELDDVEFESNFNDVIFKVKDKELIIATTRPEYIPACVALVYHPDDDRYKNLEGKFAKVPIFDYDVPIISDERVDSEKGSGIVMCCTFGDQMDAEWWHKYNLQLRVILDKDGKMNDLSGKYKGMVIKDARKQIIKDLENDNLLVNKKPIRHVVNVHERCGTPVEILKTKQWFIRILDKKQEILDKAVKINWYPKHMKVRLDHWIENLQWDWCISRQRFFGVPIPVWKNKKTGEIVIADKSQLPVDPMKDLPKGYKGDMKNLFPEEDVMDTWATSSITPQIISKWKEDDSFFKKTYPNQLRIQAHDIIRTWAFYTIVKSLLNNNSIPWKDIVISGHTLDPKGKKMSKSKGNVIDPIKVLEEYGADALRFWAASGKLGDDLSFQEKELVTGQRTVTKLWNASKFVLMHLEDYNGERPEELEIMDEWLLNRLDKIIKECTEFFDRYEYSKTKSEAENFFWNIFCDYYLEIVKDRLYNPDKRGKNARRSAQFTLHRALNCILKLFAPIMPFITEEIYQLRFAKDDKTKSIHVSKWPEPEVKYKEQKTGDAVKEIIEITRQFKAKNKLSMVEPVRLKIRKDLEGKLGKAMEDLKAVTKAEEISFDNLNNENICEVSQ